MSFRITSLPARGSTTDESRGSKTAMGWPTDSSLPSRLSPPPGVTQSDRPLMFTYWGKQGAPSQFAVLLAKAAATRAIPCTFSISRWNELFDQFPVADEAILPIEGRANLLSAFSIRSVRALQKGLRARFALDNTRAVVSLMSHIWSPWAVPVIRRAGVKHVVVVHDADRHPGDRSGLAIGWVMREAAQADHVITLTETVARRLTIARGIPEKKISVLFHPDLTYGPARNFDAAGGPLRVLFFGRILPYKGLDLLVAAIERLRQEGLPVELGVFGRGEIKPNIRARLSALGAEVENRWLHHNEFEAIFSRYQLVVAPHIEASQSGVIAAAFGSCLPVVATPVGGLVEQVTPNVTGIIADSVSVDGLSSAIRKVAEDRAFLARLQRGIAETRQERSMERFFDRIAEIALGVRR